MTCIPRVSLTDKAYGVRHKEVRVCGWSCILGLGGVRAVVSETYRKCAATEAAPHLLDVTWILGIRDHSFHLGL